MLTVQPALSANALTVLERRYLQKDLSGRPSETPADMFRRVAHNIATSEARYGAQADSDLWEDRFYEAMISLDFLPNSPTLMNAGRRLQQLSACFVLPVEDSIASIFEAVKNTAVIHQSGGGTGFSFSRLRPRNDVVQSTKGVSSGPLSFMKVFDSATEAIKQGGTRRGANMAILRVDHPDIVQFITAKEEDGVLPNFNLSVGITAEFMQALSDEGEYPLINPRNGEITECKSAGEIFDLITRAAWKSGEPGVVFLDRVNEANPTPQLGEIESTNPCGEQPLLSNESCNLGSVNLANMVHRGKIDWKKLESTVELGARFLDDVIDANRYPLAAIDAMTKGNRKVGLGVMGFADMLIKMGVPYNSDAALRAAEEIMGHIQAVAWRTSADLARQRGAFPNFAGSRLDRPDSPPVRNATVTTIAPTGSISIIAGCSSGIEPLFAVAYTRTVLDNDTLPEVNPLFEQVAREQGFHSPALMTKVAAQGSVHGMAEVPQRFRDLFVTAHEVSPDWHVRIQAAFQRHTDNAVSKTINFPNEAPVEAIGQAYRMAYEMGCKGITIYRDGSRTTQVLRKGSTGPEAAKAEASTIDGPRAPRPRPSVTKGVTEKVGLGCGRTLYITINQDEMGLCEVFLQMGKSGGCTASQSEAIGRLVSLGLRSGIEVTSIVRQLKGIRCPSPAWHNGSVALSCSDAIGRTLERYSTGDAEPGVVQEPIKSLLDLSPECPECGGMIELIEGCATCRHCGYSQCG